MIGSAVLKVNIVVRKVAFEQRIQGGEGSAEDASGGIWIQAGVWRQELQIRWKPVWPERTEPRVEL